MKPLSFKYVLFMATAVISLNLNPALAQKRSGGVGDGGGVAIDNMLAGSALAKSKASPIMERLKKEEEPYLNHMKASLPDFGNALENSYKDVEEFIVPQISEDVKKHIGPQVTGVYYVKNRIVALQTLNAVYYDESALATLKAGELGKLRLHERFQRRRILENTQANKESISSEDVVLLDAALYPNGGTKMADAETIKEAVGKRKFGWYSTPADIARGKKRSEELRSLRISLMQKLRALCTDLGVGRDGEVATYGNPERVEKFVSGLLGALEFSKEFEKYHVSSSEHHFMLETLAYVLRQEYGISEGMLHKTVDSYLKMRAANNLPNVIPQSRQKYLRSYGPCIYVRGTVLPMEIFGTMGYRNGAPEFPAIEFPLYQGPETLPAAVSTDSKTVKKAPASVSGNSLERQQQESSR